MITSLLTTKHCFPHAQFLRNVVTRPRLIERLNAGLERKLTLISAPAGYGKATLVSQWVDHLCSAGAKEDQVEYRITWLSLDKSDNDSTRFLPYTIAALRTIEADIAQ